MRILEKEDTLTKSPHQQDSKLFPIPIKLTTFVI